MSDETIYILPDCATELPKQFKAWIDFYNFIKKDWNGQAEIVHFAEYLTPNLVGNQTRITKYYMTYVKSKCFEEQENFKAPDFHIQELAYLRQLIRMDNFEGNRDELINRVGEMMWLKDKEIRMSKEKVEMP
jgi:hypothetical protein